MSVIIIIMIIIPLPLQSLVLGCVCEYRFEAGFRHFTSKNLLM